MTKQDRSLLREIILITLAVGVVGVLGFNGLDDYYRANNRQYPSSLIFYMTVQLFTLQFLLIDSDTIKFSYSWGLEVALFAAPLLASYALVRALMEIFAEPLKSIRMSFMKGHVVICGLSRKGFALVKDFRARDVPVVLVEWDKENDLIENCRDLGALMVMGDATEEVSLRKANPQRARLLFSVCDEDGVNAETAMLAQSMVTREVGKAPLEIFLHVENLKLCSLLRAHGIGDTRGGGSRFRIFNIHENAARHVLKAYPLDGTGIAANDSRIVHLVLIGFGKMGEMLALHAAQTGHYANGKKLCLTVIDRQAKTRAAQFFARFPYFEHVCDATFLNDDYDSPSVLEIIERFASDDQRLLNVIVCLPEDGVSLTCALLCADVFKEHGIPILVRLDRDSGLAVLAEHPRVTSNARIKTFVVGGSFCSEKEIVEKDRTRLARAIQEDLRANADNEHAIPAWHELDEDAHNYFRYAADHAPVKVRAIGCEIVSAKNADDEFVFTKDEIEIIAQMEHRRWRAALQLAGYRYGMTPDERRDVSRKIHPRLVEWDDLPDGEHEALRQTTARIPQWLAAAGKGVRRKKTEEEKVEPK